MKSILLFCCFCATLACTSLKKYEEKAKVWEPEIQQLEQKDKNTTDPKNAILFIGSSSIRLWSNIEKDMAPYPVIQRGYGGAHFSDLIVYAKRLVYPHQFKAVVVFVANDITGEKDDKSPQEVLKMVKILQKTIRKKYKSQPIYFIAITPTPSRWAVWNKISEVNSLVKNYCENHKNMYFIETEKSYLNADNLPNQQLFLADKLHMKQQGYDIWANLIKEKLNLTLK